MQYSTWVPMFLKNIEPPSSGENAPQKRRYGITTLQGAIIQTLVMYRGSLINSSKTHSPNPRTAMLGSKNTRNKALFQMLPVRRKNYCNYHKSATEWCTASAAPTCRHRVRSRTKHYPLCCRQPTVHASSASRHSRRRIREPSKRRMPSSAL
jgi:hypothetical protein